MKKTNLYLTIIAACCMFACIPARKYEELNQKYKLTEEDRNSTKQKLQTLEADLAELTAKATELEKQKLLLEGDTTSLGNINRRLQIQYEKINTLNDELLKKYALLQKGSQDENTKLLGELEITRTDLQKKEDALKTLEQDLNSKEKSLGTLNSELKKRELKVAELQDLLAQKELAVSSLKNKITDALLSFKNQGLTVVQKNGKVYVSLEAKLLFPSGSTEIDVKGKDALLKLAKVLEEQTEVEILVEGHTDTDKITSSVVPKTNWELSALRATAVVELMLKGSKIDPKRLIAAGRSEYLPVDNKDKSKNRRIEIVLSPNLDKIFQIINNGN